MVLADYKCMDCGDVFYSSMECAIHHLETNHNNFNIIGTDANMTVTSSNK